MIRWGACLMAAMMLSGVARADGDAAPTKPYQAFAAVCTAAIDENPDIVSIASSVGFPAAGGIKDALMFGQTSLRVFTVPQLKQNIVVTINSFGDARQIMCKLTMPVHTDRADLEDLARTLDLDGSFYDLPGGTNGAWKRRGNQPLVFVNMISANGTTLTMQRIDLSAPGPEKK